jgi:hypothetical protein
MAFRSGISLLKQIRKNVAETQALAIDMSFGEDKEMQMAITFMAVVGGLIFSVAVALLAEELIFGQVFRLFFARQDIPQTVEAKTGQKR